MTLTIKHKGKPRTLGGLLRGWGFSHEVTGYVSEGGTSDHGDLTGLADLDHPQYWTGSDGNKITVSSVAPSNPSFGDIWIDTSGV